MSKPGARRREQLRALARLTAQCRLNESEAANLRRTAEAAAWRDLKEALQAAAPLVAAHGLGVQTRLFM